MLYNKNIVLDILSSNFWDSIEDFTNGCVMDMSSIDLDGVFEYMTDYAALDSITEMKVTDYEAEKEEGDIFKELISGILEVSADIEGYAHWDGEDILIDHGEVVLGFSFSFYAEKGEYTDLDLGYLY